VFSLRLPATASTQAPQSAEAMAETPPG
jgi:hypothetical protein